MKSILFTILLSSLFFSCNSKEQSTNTSTESNNVFLEHRTKEEILNAEIKEVYSLLNQPIKSNGDFYFDSGSASAGRIAGNLKDVDITIEYLPEQPGCADICPEMAIISFKCKFNNNCLIDPAFPELERNSGITTIVDLEIASKVFDLLNRIKSKL
ncbi:hypothetical protein [Myroides fluvii]|uniref:hypothetical protein n=1 Tax=Myroides fluvii TaxID=2572594 RepID=UPI00131C4C34|nr:hypothetical protein [Myroides fluvii]